MYIQYITHAITVSLKSVRQWQQIKQHFANNQQKMNQCFTIEKLLYTYNVIRLYATDRNLLITI